MEGTVWRVQCEGAVCEGAVWRVQCVRVQCGGYSM